MSIRAATQAGGDDPLGLDEAGATRRATITLTGFAAGALDLGGDAYLLDLGGVALRYESYVTEHTSWACLRDANSGEVVEASEATGEAIDALVGAFGVAYGERAGEIEAVSATVVAHALARCHPIAYAESQA